jgi:hypothetical protein
VDGERGQKGRETGEQTNPGAVDGADLETGGDEGADLLLEVVERVERVVAEVDIALEGKGKLAMGEELGRGVGLVEPEEERPERIETTVEGQEDVWRGWVDVDVHGCVHCLADDTGVRRRLSTILEIRRPSAARNCGGDGLQCP